MPTAYFKTVTHKVVAGDTLYKLAREYNSTVDNIQVFNHIENQHSIHIGQKIVIPLSPPEAIIYTVKVGDTLYSIAKKHRTYVSNLIMYNYAVKPPYRIYPKQQLVVTASLR